MSVSANAPVLAPTGFSRREWPDHSEENRDEERAQYREVIFQPPHDHPKPVHCYFHPREVVGYSSKPNSNDPFAGRIAT